MFSVRSVFILSKGDHDVLFWVLRMGSFSGGLIDGSEIGAKSH